MAAVCLGIKYSAVAFTCLLTLSLPSHLPLFDQLAAYWMGESTTQNFDNKDQEC